MSDGEKLGPSDFDEKGLTANLDPRDLAALETTTRSVEWGRNFDGQLLRDHPAGFALKKAGLGLDELSKGLAGELEYEPVAPRLEAATFTAFSLLVAGGVIKAAWSLRKRHAK